MSSRYSHRVVAYLDFLGFKALVAKSQTDEGLADSLYKFLTRVTSGELHGRAYGQVNYDICPPEELANVEAAAAEMRRILQKSHPIAITHFSDSLVISASSDDAIASQMLFELIAQLSIEAWESLGLLVRGGIAAGNLVHEDSGALFGPAAINAYLIESKQAKFPRVVISDDAMKIYEAQQTFDIFSSLIKNDQGSNYVSLSTSLNFVLKDSPLVLQGDKALERVMTIAHATPEILQTKLAETDDHGAKEKIEWLIREMKI